MAIAVDQDRIGEAPRADAHQGGGALRGPRKRRGRYWFLIVVPVLLAALWGSGFYVVGPDERAVVRRFGAVAEQVGPGMHHRFPWPVDQVDVVRTTSVTKVDVPAPSNGPMNKLI